MKTILAPTDFSAFSENSMKAAAHIAKKTGAKVILLHCILTDTRWATMSDSTKENYPETLKKINDAELKLKEIAGRSLYNGIHVEHMIAYGTPYAEIVNIAKSKKADLIVIGSHGNEGSYRFYIGSNVQKVLREANCPVLSIKKEAQIKNWKKMVFATSLSDKISKSFLQISSIANALKLTIHLLVVNRPDEFLTTREATKKMEDFIKKYPTLKFSQSLYCHTNIEDGILEFAEDIGADWISMCTHNKKSKPGYLIGTTEAIVYRSTIPVLSAQMDK